MNMNYIGLFCLQKQIKIQIKELLFKQNQEWQQAQQLMGKYYQQKRSTIKKYSVTLERKDGLKVKYALLTAVNVKKDSIVAEGDKIGETGGIMHFEVIVNNLSVDPMLFSYR